MEDFFILTYTKNATPEQVSKAVESLGKFFPDKKIIGIPSTMTLTNYTKEEAINILEFYIDYLKGLINE